MLRLAYRELTIAAQGKEDQVAALGPLHELPRPWDPPTCRRPDLRQQLWEWLEQVVDWLNHECVWDVSTMIPACWPHHPHLVHEIAVLADQRRRAGAALTSDAMEDWNRYTLPTFTDRMRVRLKDHCEEGHQLWPARGRYTREAGPRATSDRHQSYRADVGVAAGSGRNGGTTTHASPELASVNLETGEIIEDR